jgi:glutaredoxin 3
MIEYTIYGSPNCTYCEQAKKLLDLKGLPYTYMDASSSLYFQENFVKKGVRAVPQIFVRGEDSPTDIEERHIGGFQELMKELM